MHRIETCRFNNSTLKESTIELTVKPFKKGHSQKDQKLVFMTNYRLMQVKSIAHSTIRSTFIKLPLSLRSLFCLTLSGRLRQVLL